MRADAREPQNVFSKKGKIIACLLCACLVVATVVRYQQCLFECTKLYLYDAFSCKSRYCLCERAVSHLLLFNCFSHFPYQYSFIFTLPLSNIDFLIATVACSMLVETLKSNVSFS